MICIMHGYLLEGSGSNLWTRSVVESLCRQGKTVHLFCQENHPDRYSFIMKAIRYHLDGSTKTFLDRDSGLPGRGIMHKPVLGDTLPVYVWDKYEEFSRVVPMVNLPTEEIESYLQRNCDVVRQVCRDNSITTFGLTPPAAKNSSNKRRTLPPFSPKIKRSPASAAVLMTF